MGCQSSGCGGCSGCKPITREAFFSSFGKAEDALDYLYKVQASIESQGKEIPQRLKDDIEQLEKLLGG